jgi:hypothetical protein
MARQAKKANSLYSPHPGLAMLVTWLATLKEKTGRTLDEWLQLIEAQGPKGEKERRDWLKREHGIGNHLATWMAARSFGKGLEDADPEAYLVAAERYVDDMFGGDRAALRPLYDELLSLSLNLSDDVRACPGKTIVPLYRNHVFAQIKPAIKTRIDFGLALGDTPPQDRLVSTGGYEKKDRITHRIAVSRPEDIDGFLEKWLVIAYERDGK